MQIKPKTTETDIRKQLQDYLGWRGWHVHYNLAGLGSYPGISDLTAIKNGRVVWVEVKKPGTGKQSDKQKQFQVDIEAAGGEYVIARSIEDLKEVGIW